MVPLIFREKLFKQTEPLLCCDAAQDWQRHAHITVEHPELRVVRGTMTGRPANHSPLGLKRPHLPEPSGQSGSSVGCPSVLIPFILRDANGGVADTSACP